MAVFVKYLVMTSVIFLMLTVGLRIKFGEIIEVVKQFQLMMRGLLANFLVVPALIYVCLFFLPLSPDVKIGIMIMAAAPIAPMAPPFVAMAKGDVPYAVGLMTIVAVLSVALTPLILSLALPKSEEGLNIDPWQIIETLLTVQLIPICIGMAIHHFSSTWTRKLLKFVPKLGQIGLLIGVGFILVIQAKQILSIGMLAYVVLVLLVIAMLFIGDWMLFRESTSRRRSLAVSTAIRNIPLAFLIANSNFPGTIVAPVTLIFSVFTMVFAVIYGKLMARSEA